MNDNKKNVKEQVIYLKTNYKKKLKINTSLLYGHLLF